MSKRNLRGVLLLASALSLGVLGTVVSCNQKTENPGPVENDTWKDFVVDNTIASLTITNKDAIEAEWWVGEDDRTLELDLGKEYNLASLIYENKIMAVSSNPDVATVIGLKIQAVAQGTATIEVRAGTHKATVTLTIKQDHLKVGGEYSLEEIVKIPNTKKKWFKSSAVITGWVKGTDGQQFGNIKVAKDWTKGAKSYEIYGATGKTATEGGSYVDSKGETVKVESVLSEKKGIYTFNNPRDWLTNEKTKDLQVGDKITFDCIRCDKDGVIKLSLWNVKYVDHKDLETAPEPDPVQFTSLEQVLSGTKEDNKAKKFIGKVKIKGIKGDKYGNLFFEVPESLAADYPDGLTVYGSTATTTAITWDGVNEEYTFNNPNDYLTNDLTKNLVAGQEIDVELIRADFEKDGKVTKKVSAVIKNATQIDPTAIAVSGDVLEVEEGKTITLIAKTTPAFTTRKLTWASSDETVATVKDGKVVGVKAGTAKITASYGTIVSNEVTITVKASTSESSVLAQYNFVNFNGKTDELTAPVDISSKLVEGGDIATVSAVSNCSAGYIDTKNNIDYTNLGLKFGTSKKAGMITFDLSVTIAKKMIIVGIGWMTSDKISVGETSYTSEYKYNDANVVLGNYEFDITGSSQVVVNLTKRYYITSVTFTK